LRVAIQHIISVKICW